MIMEDYEALKCRYPSKKCWNQRAVKRNGERHNLCEMHRQKANNNQRRLDKKRKAGHQLSKSGSPGAPPPPAAVALELRAAPAGNPTPEQETSEYDYRRHQHHHHHEQQLQLQREHQQYLYQQHPLQHQQEKRLRVSLNHMYAAAQSLSPHSPPRHTHAHHPYRRHTSASAAHPIKRERELAPLRPSSSVLPPPPPPTSSVAARPPMLHLPPLTAHIPALRSSPLRLPTPAASSSPQETKPTILLPPITSVPRCHPSGTFPLPRAGGAAPSVSLPSWSYRSEEKINSA